MLVLFACKGPSSLHKSSKRRNRLKPKNLETPFLLSALKIPVKSVTSYQAEITYKTRKSPLIFRFCNCIFRFQHWNMSFLMLEIKSFVSLKNECCFLGREDISKGESSSPKFWGVVAHKKRSDRFRIFFKGWVGKKGWCQYFRVGADTLEDSMER